MASSKHRFHFTKKVPQDKEDLPKCAFHGCQEPGSCPAPSRKNHSVIYENYCAHHAAEINKSWDYYKKLSEAEVHRLNDIDLTWRRPRRPFGVGSVDPFKHMGKKDDPFDFFYEKAKPKKEKAHDEKFQAALTLLDIPYPFEQSILKNRFRTLAKKYHPDHNPQEDEKASEIFKKICDAYHYLSNYAQENIPTEEK